VSTSIRNCGRALKEDWASHWSSLDAPALLMKELPRRAPLRRRQSARVGLTLMALHACPMDVRASRCCSSKALPLLSSLTAALKGSTASPATSARFDDRCGSRVDFASPAAASAA
jgi:hypothetical protein